MTGTYEVSRYRSVDKPHVAALQRDLWSTDPELSVSYLEWKYEQNPYLDFVPIYLAWHRGKPVAMRGFYGGEWEVGRPQQKVLVYCADDLVIAPGHRNRGLFTLLMKAALEDLERAGNGFAVTLSGGPATVFGSLTMGWKSIGRTELLRRESRAAAIARLVRGATGRVPFLRPLANRLPAPWEGNPFARLDARSPQSTPDASGVWMERRPASGAMAEVVEQIGSTGRLRHVRDANYFDWRFRNPMHEYRFLYSGDPRVNGYLVLRRGLSDRFDRASVYLSDWEGADNAIREKLLRAAIAWGEFSYLIAWSATLSDEARSILRREGFVEAGQPGRGIPCVLVRPLRSGVPEREWIIGGQPLLELSSWELRMLYSMQG
jgi:GNAT superfamily N-acetyltransferase